MATQSSGEGGINRFNIIEQIQKQAQRYRSQTDPHTSAIGYEKHSTSGGKERICAPNTLLSNATRYEVPRTTEDLRRIELEANESAVCIFGLLTSVRCSSKGLNNVCMTHLTSVLSLVPHWGKSTVAMTTSSYIRNKPFLLTFGNMMYGQPIQYYRDVLSGSSMKLSANDLEIMAALLYYMYHADNSLDKTNSFLYALTNSTKRTTRKYHENLEHLYVDIGMAEDSLPPLALTQYSVEQDQPLVSNTVSDGQNIIHMITFPLQYCSTLDIALLTMFMGTMCDGVSLVPNTYLAGCMLFAGTGYGVTEHSDKKQVGKLHRNDPNRDVVTRYLNPATVLALPVRYVNQTDKQPNFKVHIHLMQHLSPVKVHEILCELQTLNPSLVVDDQTLPVGTPLPVNGITAII